MVIIPLLAIKRTHTNTQRWIENTSLTTALQVAPQEWIASLSWCINQIESDLCVQNIWAYSIIILFCYCLSGTPLMNVSPFAWPCWGFAYKCLISLSRSLISHVTSSPTLKRTQQLEIREEFMMYFCVCLKDFTILKTTFCLSSHFFHFFWPHFLSCFWNFKLRGRSRDILHSYSHHF